MPPLQHPAGAKVACREILAFCQELSRPKNKSALTSSDWRILTGLCNIVLAVLDLKYIECRNPEETRG